jgi:hypothetical protein
MWLEAGRDQAWTRAEPGLFLPPVCRVFVGV